MSRTRRTSSVLETTQQRAAGLRSINPPPEFGPGITLAGYDADVRAFSDRLNSYNERLASLDQLQNELDTAENDLREKNRRILAAAEAHYGPDSSEYEQVGGTRSSERGRGGRPKGESPTVPQGEGTAPQGESPTSPPA